VQKAKPEDASFKAFQAAAAAKKKAASDALKKGKQ